MCCALAFIAPLQILLLKCCNSWLNVNRPVGDHDNEDDEGEDEDDDKENKDEGHDDEDDGEDEESEDDEEDEDDNEKEEEEKKKNAVSLLKLNSRWYEALGTLFS